MIKVEPLTVALSWRGKYYPKGAIEIPEDLAIALGLSPQEAEEAIDPPPLKPTEAQQELEKLGIAPPEEIPEKPVARRRRKEG